MKLEPTEYYVTKESCGECITISKEALAKLRDHYLKVADRCKKEPFKWGFYIGKAEVLIDILKHFDEE